jgi:uncharacterized OB-fold protein
MTPMQQMAESAADGKLGLERCTACGTVQYPPRELCALYLTDKLEWRVTEAEGGEVLAATALHRSHEAAFRDTLPLCVGPVRLDPGPTVVCWLPARSQHPRIVRGGRICHSRSVRRHAAIRGG